MSATLSTVLPEQAAEVGQLVFEAFRDVAERHGFGWPFPSPEFAEGVVRLLAQTEGCESYLLVEDGKPVACNFGDERDEAVGVGPVAVAVDQQGHGYGRRVMEALLDRADEAGVASVRLTQATYNVQSFALYHKLGFEVKELLANIRGRSPEGEETSDPVRDYTADDLDACDALHRDVLGIGRRNDIEYMARFVPPVVVERDGQIAGYLTRFPGENVVVMHGAARDERALRDLLIGTARVAPGDLHIGLPASQPETLRWAMANGFRMTEMGSYMVRGEYQRPMGAWIPSPFY